MRKNGYLPQPACIMSSKLDTASSFSAGSRIGSVVFVTNLRIRASAERKVYLGVSASFSIVTKFQGLLESKNQGLLGGIPN